MILRLRLALVMCVALGEEQTIQTLAEHIHEKIVRLTTPPPAAAAPEASEEDEEDFDL